MDVFLSYAREDAGDAALVAEALRDAGHSVWRPEENLYAGDNWHRATADALEQSDAVVVLWSRAGADSPSVQSEVDYALGSKNHAGRLIPVTVESTDDVPWILKKLRGVNMQEDRTAGLRELVDVLDSV